jgi:hypothetical protein
LRELAHNQNPSIALQARWELRNTKHKLPSDAAHPDYIPGFLEGDFGLRAPMPWAVEFALPYCHDNAEELRLIEFYRKAGAAQIGRSTFAKADGKRIQHPTLKFVPELHQTSYGPSAPKNIEIAKDAAKLSITVDNQKIPISADLFPCGQASGVWNLDQYQVAAILGGDNVFVAVYQNNWAPLSLYCLERRSGRIIWRSVAWAAYVDFAPGGSGFWYSDAQLVCDGSKITVFGRGTYSGSYIESFDVKTGKNQLRFSSRYWNRRGTEEWTLTPVSAR